MRIREIRCVAVIFFMFSFVAGILFLNLFMRSYVISTGIFSDYFLEQYRNIQINKMDYLLYILGVRLMPLLIFTLAGSLKFKKIVASVSILIVGFLTGILLTAAVTKLGIKGILLCTAGILPHFICYIAVYLMLLVFYFTYPDRKWNGSKTVSVILFMLTGIVAESYINPMLMKLMMNILDVR